jgi:uncharacterized protein YegL
MREGAGVRRLPVLFVIEASSNLSGTLEVAMRQGLETIAYTLADDPVAARVVYLSTVVFNQTIVVNQRLTNITRYSVPAWEASGEASLGCALDQLAETLRFGFISGDETRPGDLPPMIFLALGSEFTDDWEPHITRLRALPAMRHAHVFAIVSKHTLAALARGITANIISLEAASSAGVGMAPTPAILADRVTRFFDWVSQAVLLIAESQHQQASVLTLPPLPPELIVVQ